MIDYHISDIDISLLPAPTNTLKFNNIEIYQWGWCGIQIESKMIKNHNFNISEIRNFLLNNGHGVFFILLRDSLANETVFFVDRFSAKKIFYIQKKNKIYFSDFLYKIKEINNHRQIDISALSLYLLFGYIITNRTLYKNVRTLKPYTYYEFKKNRIKERQYYKFKFRDERINYLDSVKNLFHFIEEDFINLSKSHNQFLIPLSGGQDSRLILALTLKHFSKDKIMTYTFGQKGSMDYEIGKWLAKKYEIRSFLLNFTNRTYFNEYVLPSTKFMSTCINHSYDASANQYSRILGDKYDVLILTGYDGSLVMTWKCLKPLNRYNNHTLPKTNMFGYKDINNIFSDYWDDTLEEIKSAMKHLDVEERNGEFYSALWDYYVRDPYFNSFTQYCEKRFYPFAFPFWGHKFLDYIQKVPKAFKLKSTFYGDMLRTDPYVYSFFKYPLKNYSGYGMGNKKLHDIYEKVKLHSLAVFFGGRPKKNYINFNKAYNPEFFKKHIHFLYNYDFIKPILRNWEKYPFKIKTLLLSLRLNLETFF